MQEQEVLKVAEVAVLMRLSPQRVYSLVREGALPAVRVGGRIVIPRPAWDAWLARQSRAAMENARKRGPLETRTRRGEP